MAARINWDACPLLMLTFSPMVICWNRFAATVIILASDFRDKVYKDTYSRIDETDD